MINLGVHSMEAARALKCMLYSLKCTAAEDLTNEVVLTQFHCLSSDRVQFL